MVVNKGSGKGSGTMQTSEHGVSGPTLALTSSAVAPRAEVWHAGVAGNAMPGVAFHYHLGTPPPLSEVGSQRRTSLDDDLARLESVSQISSQRSRKSRRSDQGPDSPLVGLLRLWLHLRSLVPTHQPLLHHLLKLLTLRVATVLQGRLKQLRPGVPMPKPSARQISRVRVLRIWNDNALYCSSTPCSWLGGRLMKMIRCTQLPETSVSMTVAKARPIICVHGCSRTDRVYL